MVNEVLLINDRRFLKFIFRRNSFKFILKNKSSFAL